MNENGKYIIFFDHYDNIYINLNNAFPIFDHYKRKGRKDAIYFLLNNSQLYYQLKKENNFDNILFADKYKKNHELFIKKVLHLFLNNKLKQYEFQ